jgi:hypothetical protein
MDFGIEKEAIVPGLTFLGLFLLVVAAAMLNLYPSSEWLWWVNLAIGREVTDVFILLDHTGMGSASLQTTLFAVLACLSIWSSGRFWRHRIFFLNHLAAMFIGLALFGPASVMSAFVAGPPQGAFGWFAGIPGLEDAALWALFAASLVSCVATHLQMLFRNRAY